MNASPLSLYRSRYRICSFGSPREFSMYNLGFQNLLNSMDSDCGNKEQRSIISLCMHNRHHKICYIEQNLTDGWLRPSWDRRYVISQSRFRIEMLLILIVPHSIQNGKLNKWKITKVKILAVLFWPSRVGSLHFAFTTTSAVNCSFSVSISPTLKNCTQIWTLTCNGLVDILMKYHRKWFCSITFLVSSR